MHMEIRRQLFHAIIGSAIILLFLQAGRINFMIFSGILFLLGCAISFAVLKGVKIPLIENALHYFGREDEKGIPGKGALTVMLGMFLLVMLFSKNEVILGGMIVAVFGDAASTFAGKTIGSTRVYAQYTLEGTIAGVVVSSLLLLLLFPLWIAVIAATIGMLAEWLHIDDNISIPLVTATALTLLL